MGNYIYLLTYEKSPLLKKDQMYLFFLTKTNNGYYEMMPRYGSMLLDNEDEKLKQIDAVRKVMKEN
ncbi:hypothetical protein ACSU6B_02125 [Neobacillus sp. C211]|uniref:hypothetical protein n=1 Tax=unclassified Neobacillus TaxID=2675272 RepID=UPI003978934B